MDQILIQISKYHRLSIICALGMWICLMIGIYFYRKNHMKSVIECFWINRKKKEIWIALLFCVFVVTFGMKTEAAAIGFADENGNPLTFSEDEVETVPYYNGGKEIVIDLQVDKEFLDEEQSFAKLIRTDVKGNVLEEELLELLDEGTRKRVSLDGHYQLIVHLVDQEGNITLHEKKFALDHEPPMEPVVEYETEEMGILKRWFHQLTFGYFAKEKVNVLILVEDLASAVSKVIYSYQDIEMETPVTETVEVAEGELGTIKVELPFSFKGRVQVQSEDALGHVSTNFCDIGLIAESEDVHEQASKAEIQVKTKSLKTQDYYNEDVELLFSVQDTYSGIQSVSYMAGEHFSETKSYEDEAEISTEEIVKEYTLFASENQGNEIPIGLQFLDFAGHETKLSEEQLPKIHIDTIAPKIQVTYDNEDAVNEKYFQKPRAATIVVTERNFDPKDVEFELKGPKVQKDGWTHQAAYGCTGGGDPYHTGHMDDCQWKCQVEFFEDGEYEFGFSCTDLAGNKGDYEGKDEFIIDQTKPEIGVTYDNLNVHNEMYYGAPRTGIITIREKNFDPEDVKIKLTATLEGQEISIPKVSAWNSSEDVHQAVIPYDYDGVFTFEIAYEDLAGNEGNAYGMDYFCIDLTNPKITIDGVAHKSANQGAVMPVINMEDTNFAKDSVFYEITGYKNGKIYPKVEKQRLPKGTRIKISDLSPLENNDDLYCLTARGMDLAGNKTEMEIWYSVNRFGSVYTLDESTKQLAGEGGSYYTAKAAPMLVTETNVDTLVFQEIVCNWNGELKTLVKDLDYRLRESGDEFEWKQYEYFIDAKTFEKEGHYVLTIYSKDRANNLSDNQSKGKSITFAVDCSAPDIWISGVEDGGTYREKEKEILIHVQDNLALKNVEVFLNGETYVYDEKQLQELKGKILIPAKGANDWQSLWVTAKDMAGNAHSTAKIQFLVTPNLLIQLWNHKPLLYTTGGCTLGICLVGGWLIRRKYSRRKSS